MEMTERQTRWISLAVRRAFDEHDALAERIVRQAGAVWDGTGYGGGDARDVFYSATDAEHAAIIARLHMAGVKVVAGVTMGGCQDE